MLHYQKDLIPLFRTNLWSVEGWGKGTLSNTRWPLHPQNWVPAWRPRFALLGTRLKATAAKTGWTSVLLSTALWSCTCVPSACSAWTTAGWLRKLSWLGPGERRARALLLRHSFLAVRRFCFLFLMLCLGDRVLFCGLYWPHLPSRRPEYNFYQVALLFCCSWNCYGSGVSWAAMSAFSLWPLAGSSSLPPVTPGYLSTLYESGYNTTCYCPLPALHLLCEYLK